MIRRTAVVGAAALLTLIAGASAAATTPPPVDTTDISAPGHDHGPSAPLAPGSPDRPIRGPQGNVGQFVVECGFSHFATADPIVHPGVEGAGHLHAFFGSTLTAADSTLDELVAGPSTCGNQRDTAAYWAPALFSDGEPVEPLDSRAYYRAGEGVDPTTVEAYPPGLKLLAGDPAAQTPQSPAVVGWTCNAGADRLAQPPDCPIDATLRVILTFPDCWDGERTDSPDHRAHAAYSSGGACPDTHPVAIPQLQFAIDYPALGPETLTLSSGDVLGAHADFWNTWDQDALTREVTACLHRDAVCNVSG